MCLLIAVTDSDSKESYHFKERIKQMQDHKRKGLNWVISSINISSCELHLFSHKNWVFNEKGNIRRH